MIIYFHNILLFQSVQYSQYFSKNQFNIIILNRFWKRFSTLLSHNNYGLQIKMWLTIEEYWITAIKINSLVAMD